MGTVVKGKYFMEYEQEKMSRLDFPTEFYLLAIPAIPDLDQTVRDE